MTGGAVACLGEGGRAASSGRRAVACGVAFGSRECDVRAAAISDIGHVINIELVHVLKMVQD